MKVQTLCEIHSARGVIPAGQIIDINPAILERLAGKVKPVPVPRTNGGKDLPTYCCSCDCWCSARLPAHMNPSPCRKCQPKEIKL